MGDTPSPASSPRFLGLPRPLWVSLLAATATALAFLDTSVSIVAIWSRSETFAHGFFVLPIFLWLVWRERETLAALPPSPPDGRPLPLIAAVGFAWLLSRTAGILVGEQLALVLMIILVIHAFAGREIARAIRFPILFLLFLAPVGEELVPQLMEITADLTVGAIALTGIPIYREGLFFSLPSGNWSVVEACSGIRYLIASITLGSLYAYLSYRSTGRRLAFIALSAVVPILANGVRAFLIVMIGHFSGMKLATGVDHLVYGWLFFGVVMFVLFSIGALFREPDGTKNEVDERRALAAANRDAGTTVATTSIGTSRLGSRTRHALVAGLCIAIWPLWASAINATSSETSPNKAIVAMLLPADALPPEAGESQSSERATMIDWRPLIGGHDAAREALIHDSSDATTAPVLALAYAYTDQRQGKEMISSANVLVPTKDSDWRRIARTSTSFTSSNEAAADAVPIVVEQTRLRSNADGPVDQLLVWRWYRVGDVHTNKSWLIKLLETRERLLLRRTPSVAYVLAVDASRVDAVAALGDAAARIVAVPERPVATERR